MSRHKKQIWNRGTDFSSLRKQQIIHGDHSVTDTNDDDDDDDDDSESRHIFEHELFV